VRIFQMVEDGLTILVLLRNSRELPEALGEGLYDDSGHALPH